MNNLYKYIGVIILICFSFYYTDKSVDLIRRNDPIMKEINKNKDEYYISSVNAIIDDDKISLGSNGKAVDLNESYKKMKKYNKYDSNLLVYKEIIPNISYLDNKDKYIVRSNPNYNNISLIFKIDDLSNVSKLYNILANKDVKGTFFISSDIIINNNTLLEQLSNIGHEIENLDIFDKFDYVNNIISSITNNNPLFCITEKEDKNIINFCNDKNFYTILPTICYQNPFITVKKELDNGKIFYFNIDNKTIKELPIIISYIKQKGYNIKLLKDLISENYIE